MRIKYSTNLSVRLWIFVKRGSPGQGCWLGAWTVGSSSSSHFEEDAVIFAAAAIELEASCDTICEAEEDAWVASIFAALLDPVNANKLALRPLASTTSPDLESDDKAFTSLELWCADDEANFMELLASLIEAAVICEEEMASLFEAIIELLASPIEATETLEAIWVDEEAAA